MKKLPIFLAALCLAATANFSQAQTHTRPASLPNTAYCQNLVKQITGMQLCKALHKTLPNARTTTTYERLVAASGYNTYVGLTDSFVFVYNGGGSIFDFNYMTYNYVWLMNSEFPYGYGTSVAKIAHDGQPAVFSDTAKTYSNINAMFGYYCNFSSVYDTNYNLTNYSVIYPFNTTTYPDMMFLNTFDTYENITASYTFARVPGGTWDSSRYKVFTYNTGHNVIKDSTGMYDSTVGAWVPEIEWFYSYNAYGKISQAICFTYDGISAWDSAAIYTYTYNSDTLLQEFTVKEPYLSGGPLLPFYADSLGYTSGIPYVTYQKEATITALGNYYTINTKHINGSGLPDTVYTTMYDSLYNVISGSKISYIFDAYSNPTASYSYNIDTTTHPWSYHTMVDDTYNYYYEVFTPGPSWIRHINGTTSVNNIPTAQADIKVYPNPATNVINISEAGVVNGTRRNIVLLNELGKIVMSQNIPWYGQSQQVSLSGLTPSAYWLLIQDNEGHNLYRQTIIKQ